ncbi:MULTISPECIES: cytochrome c oxidase subunit II [Rufibacter]|uniref:Cytochrome c oxidase subunit 2 n=1 Tax=Rufibacter quisquiliarum TaxID=1549639 RepID=A0A839GJH3_9BACT|nr:MULTISPECIES: cytochrome c oxidase subunit II [Rufibacter]MBA9079012.1 cytochrome c oxidase subunit 2 [Rufibacter quisquiliarum]
MITIAVALSIILLLVTLYLLFRIQILASIFKGSYRRDVGKSNKVNAVLLLVFFFVMGGLFIWSFMDAKEDMILPNASVHGIDIDQMFWLTMAVIGIVFVITHILLFVYSYKYQHQDGKRAYFYPHNNKIEIIWTVIPAVVMALLVFSGWKTWAKITSPAPQDAVVVEIMGKQFNWLTRYPGADNKLGVVKHTLITAENEFGIDLTDQNSADDFPGEPSAFHVPKGTPVLLKIRSRDVIHSVFLPHFRVKMDAVPGMPTSFWFIPTKTTAEMQTETGNPDFQYELACTEVCGRGHFAMKTILVVDEPEEYKKWVEAQSKKTFATTLQGGGSDSAAVAVNSEAGAASLATKQ